ncbi:hypothetical protein VISI1226_03970 [Vibrio sinaloensis DSM 21326]|uniref:Rhs family protein n=1 Tax=Vibrio sinaloensis DSM 21326 TaxID=945550 RepID=E8MCK0_PHOS4|nr:RHS repeat-associated core domain-containing protein [Vibrio sinaloensis]EGA68243.1 hypothetical protein VISI1226_03970 [Vibrio sinaloensis DSM 21326]
MTNNTVLRLLSGLSTIAGLFIANLSVAAPTNGEIELSGDFSVSGGKANYVLPISVNPGRAGHQPSLKLEYRGTVSNGPLGVGWGLAGTSSITRCGKSLTTDGSWGGVNFNSDDRYCLDGQRLVSIAGKDGGSMTEYRVERNGYSKVVSYNEVNGGPSKFIVWNKDGSFIEYGANDHSKVELPNQNKVYKWSINRISDSTQSNFIDYTYVEENAHGAHYLSKITYVGGAINFSYEDRPDQTRNYFHGEQTQRLKRLKSISTLDSANQALGVYSLTYATSASSGKSQLTRVEYCANGHCSTPIDFVWSEGSVSNYEWGQPEAGQYSSTVKLNEALGKVYDVDRDGLLETYGLYDVDIKSRCNGREKGGWTHRLPSGKFSGFAGFNSTLMGGEDSPSLKFSGLKYYDTGDCRRGEHTRWTIGDDGKSIGSYKNSNGQFVNYDPSIHISGDFSGDGNIGLKKRAISDSEKIIYAVDFDNDGRDDWIILKTSGNKKTYKLALSSLSYKQMHLSFLQSGSHSIQYIDLNNDGLLDVAFTKRTKVQFKSEYKDSIHYYYFDGKRFRKGGDITGVAKDVVQSIQFQDIDRDGYLDLLVKNKVNNTRQLYVFKNHFGRLTKEKISVNSNAALRYYDYLDLNSDGIYDLVSLSSKSKKENVPEILIGKITLSKPKVVDRLVGIREFSIDYDIEYKHLADRNVHTQVKYNKSDVKNITPTKYVVSGVVKTPKGYRATEYDYHYTGAKYHTKGGGFLGFSKITETEKAEVTTATSTEYLQEDIYRAGLPSRRTVFKNFVKVSAVDYEYLVNQYQGVSAKYYQVYAQETTKRTFDLARRSQLKRETLTQTLNKFGGLVNESITTTGPAVSDGAFVSERYIRYKITDSFKNYNAFRKVGQIAYEKTSITDKNTGLVRTVQTNYSYKANGLVSTATTKGSNYDSGSKELDASKFLVERFDYDNWGNTVYRSVSGSELKSRVTKTEFDGQGLFPTGIINALSHREKVTYNARGLIKKKVSALKGRTSNYRYDDFGRLIEETLPGVNNENTFEYKLGSDCGVYATTQSATCVIKKSSTGETVSTFADYSGREVRKLHVGFSGKLVSVDTVWDRNGRKKSVTRPYFIEDDNKVTRVLFVYDALNREVRKYEPTSDGSNALTFTRYQGNKTTYTDARKFKHSTTVNVYGHITRKDEPDGAFQAYTYYPDGKLKETIDAEGNKTIIGYDSLGFRSSLDDPDLGHWSYTYNALGELTYKRDAKGAETTIEYDALGRKKVQIIDGQRSEWRYDQNGALGTLSAFTGNGNETLYYYNESGLTLERVVKSQGQTLSSQYVYDDFERLAREIRPNNPLQNVSHTSPEFDGLVLDTIYNPYGYMSAVRSPKTFADEVFTSSSFRNEIRTLRDTAIRQAQAFLAKAERYANQRKLFSDKAQAYNRSMVNVHQLDASSLALAGGTQRYQQWCSDSGVCYLRPTSWVLIHGDVIVPVNVVRDNEVFRLETTHISDSVPGVRLHNASLVRVSKQELDAQPLTKQHDFVVTDYRKDGGLDLVSEDDVYVAKVDNKTRTELVFTATELAEAAEIADTKYRFYTDLAEKLISAAEMVDSLQATYCNYANQLAGKLLRRDTKGGCENSQQTSQAEQLNQILTQSELEDSLSNPAYIYYWQRRETDAYDHTLSETLGNGLVNTYVHNKNTGRVSYITTHKGSSLFNPAIPGHTNAGHNIRLLHYRYDKHNNVTYRYDEQLGITDTWGYDGLDRVTSNRIALTRKDAHGLNNPDLSGPYLYSYDKLGNIQSKTGIGRFEYDEVNAGPHAVTKANGLNYAYDANGNMVRAWADGSSTNEREINWTAFNKPAKITRGGKSVEFFYDANHNRYLKKNSDGEQTFYLGKSYERIVNSKTGNVEHKHFIYADGKLIALNSQVVDRDQKLQNRQIRYLHYDALNSVDMITDGYGYVVERRSYDTWGKQRKVTWKYDGPVDIDLDALTNRGYTGHEEITEIGLIHMNGRVYDQELGRFTSADPIIQSPYISNSFNRYSYVWNNPLKYTDPTGYRWEEESGTSASGEVQVDEETSNFGYNGRDERDRDEPKNGSSSEKRETPDTEQSLKDEANEEESLIEKGKKAYIIGGLIYHGAPEGVIEDASVNLNANAEDVVAARRTAKILYAAGGVAGRGKGIKVHPSKVVEVDVTNKTGKKYVTYTAEDLDNPGKIYTGRCSGTCDMTPQQILDKRKAGHHRNLGDLQLDQVTDSYPAIRGREQQVLESLRKQGLATDQINGVGPRNKKKDLYMEAAKKTFGE